jgi:hypothetical protein
MDVTRRAVDTRHKYFAAENTLIVLPGLQAAALMAGLVHYTDTVDLFRRR